MAEDIRGYVTNEIIRNSSGSPGSWFIFNQLAESIMIDNIGSSPIYFNFNSGVDVTNSGAGFIDKFTFRVFDARAGSVSIQASGLTSPMVQVIKLN